MDGINKSNLDRIPQEVFATALDYWENHNSHFLDFTKLFVQRRIPWERTNADALAEDLALSMGSIAGFVTPLRETPPEEVNEKALLQSVLSVSQNASAFKKSLEGMGRDAQSLILGELAPWPNATNFLDTDTWKWITSIAELIPICEELLKDAQASRGRNRGPTWEDLILNQCVVVLAPLFKDHEEVFPHRVREVAREIFRVVTGKAEPAKYRYDTFPSVSEILSYAAGVEARERPKIDEFIKLQEEIGQLQKEIAEVDAGPNTSDSKSPRAGNFESSGNREGATETIANLETALRNVIEKHGIVATERLSREFVNRLEQARRDAKIYDLRATMTEQAIADRYGLDPRRVRQIVGEQLELRRSANQLRQ